MTTIFKHDKFTDFKGDVHNFTVAAVLMPFKPGEASLEVTVADPELLVDDDMQLVIADGEPVILDTTETLAPVFKMISIGIAICNPTDKFVPFKGERQAEGRAVKYCDRVIAASKGGMLTEAEANYFLDVTVANIITNPGLFIKGYNDAERKWKAQHPATEA